MVKKKEESDTTAKVERKKGGKQEELPTLQHSDRKIVELEDLGDALADFEDEKSAISEKVKDANENLVAAMKRRERTYYSRATWGSIVLSESSVKAKVKKGGPSASGGDSEAEE